MIDTNGEEFVDYPGGCYPISGEESGEHDKPRYLWSGEYMLVRENGGSERYVINKEGKIIPGCVIDDISPREILTDDGLVLMRNAQKKVGVISVDGTWLLEPEYSKISVFDNRILAYRSAEDGKILCVFDLLGNMIFPDNSSGNSNQGDVYIYPVSKMMDEKMKYGYMDVRGKLVIGYQYDQTSLFSTDLGVAFAVKDGYSGIIDTNGNWIIPPKFKGFMHPQMETLSF